MKGLNTAGAVRKLTLPSGRTVRSTRRFVVAIDSPRLDARVLKHTNSKRDADRAFAQCVANRRPDVDVVYWGDGEVLASTASGTNEEATMTMDDELRKLYPTNKAERLAFTRAAQTLHAQRTSRTKSPEPIELRAFNQWKQEGSPMPDETKTKTPGGGRRASIEDLRATLLDVLAKADPPVATGSAATKALRTAGFSASGGPVRRLFAELVAEGAYVPPKKEKAEPVQPTPLAPRKRPAKPQPKPAAKEVTPIPKAKAPARKAPAKRKAATAA